MVPFANQLKLDTETGGFASIETNESYLDLSTPENFLQLREKTLKEVKKTLEVEKVVQEVSKRDQEILRTIEKYQEA